MILFRPTRILIWFAANPQMVFTSSELMRKFNIPREHFRMTIRPLVKAQFVIRTVHPSDKRRRVYSVGPALLEII